MKRNNDKGFTLIEIIGVIIILGIIAVIAINTYKSNERTFRKEYYSSLERTISDSGQEYFSDYRKYKPDSVLEARSVPLITLETENYIDKVKDYTGYECNKDSYVLIVKEDKDNYSYHTCLVCEGDDYKNTEDDEFCDPAWLDNESNIQYTIENFRDQYIYIGTSQDELRSLLRLPVSVVRTLSNGKKVYREGTGIDNIPQVLPVDLDRVDTNTEGEYKVNYEYQVDINTVEREEVKVFVYQNKMLYPTMRYKNVIAQNMKGDTTTTEGTFISGNWAQKISISLSSESIVEPRVSKAKYQWYKDGEWQDFCRAESNGACSRELMSEMSGEVKFRMVDSKGHVSTETEVISINIDTTAPTCELQHDGPKGLDDWYIGETSITFKEKKDLINMFTLDSSTVSGIKISNIRQEGLPLDRTNSLDKLDFYDDMRYVKFNGYVEDQAGNFAICTTSFKIDVSPPVCELTDYGEKIITTSKWWTSDVVTIRLTSKDDPTSGLADYGMSDGSTETFNHKTEYTLTYDVEDKMYYGYVKNNAGVVGSCTLPVSRDTVVPGCTLGSSGTEGLNDWYISDVLISLTDKSDATSGLMNYDIEEQMMPYLPDDVAASTVPEKTVTLNKDTESKTYYAHTRDNAGHMSHCDITVKRDTVAPEVNIIYPSYNSFMWTILDRTSKVYGVTVDNSIVTPSEYTPIEGNKEYANETYYIRKDDADRYYVHARDNAGLTGQAYIDTYIVTLSPGEGTTMTCGYFNETRAVVDGAYLKCSATVQKSYYGLTFTRNGTLITTNETNGDTYKDEINVPGPLTYVSSTTLCPYGYRQAKKGGFPIEACEKTLPPDHYVDHPYDPESTACECGYYRNKTEQVPYGSYTPYNERCSACEPGYYCPCPPAISPDDNYIPPTVRKKCNCGRYTDQYAKTECDLCQPGYYQPLQAQTGCIAADPGHYAYGQGRCNQSKCSCGTWNSQYAQAECTKCEGGTYLSEIGMTYNACVSASVGHYAPAGACYERECPAGSAQDKTGQSSCNNCGNGYYQPNTAQTSCLPCDWAHGYWSNYYRATECWYSCDKGSYCYNENYSYGSCDVSCGWGNQSYSASYNCYSYYVSGFLCSSEPTSGSTSCYAGSCEPPCEGQNPMSMCAPRENRVCVCSDGVSCGHWVNTGHYTGHNPSCCTSDSRYPTSLVCDPHEIYTHTCSC